MTFDEFVQYYKTVPLASAALNTSIHTIYGWSKKNYIPYHRQLEIEKITNGALKAEFSIELSRYKRRQFTKDLSCPCCLRRLRSRESATHKPWNNVSELREMLVEMIEKIDLNQSLDDLKDKYTQQIKNSHKALKELVTRAST